jgi:putative thioredoxin
MLDPVTPEIIVDITEENAQQYLIEESNLRLVLIDFWADWCGPCKSLMPILEKLAGEYAGQFLLARVNADEQQMITSQFGVRSLPPVVLMKEGQPVDGFAGAQSEQEVRKLLEKHLPSASDLLLEQANALIQAEDYASALSLLSQAYKDSNAEAQIALSYAGVLIHLKRLDDAATVLGKIRMVDQDAIYNQLMAQLELAQKAGKTPELTELEDKFKRDPENRTLQFQLAVQYSQHEYHKDALALLFPILQENLNFSEGEGKKIFMDILSVLGKGDPVAVEYQRKLYTLLY